MSIGKRPAKEIADYMGKVTLVPNLSCLFYAGTHMMVGLEVFKMHE